jgi:hypothetical protein
MSKENLSGSYNDKEVTIIGNDPKHNQRKRKMRNLDEKPTENQITWTRGKKLLLFGLMTVITIICLIWNELATKSLAPPL